MKQESRLARSNAMLKILNYMLWEAISLIQQRYPAMFRCKSIYAVIECVQGNHLCSQAFIISLSLVARRQVEAEHCSA